jgi:hypothetical protein
MHLSKVHSIGLTPESALGTKVKKKRSNCIFDGFLQRESQVYVTITGGCSFHNSFEVIQSIPPLNVSRKKPIFSIHIKEQSNLLTTTTLGTQ